MKEIHRTFRLTKKEEDILIDCSKIKNQNISDFLRFLINQKKDIFNCKKEDLIFFHSRFSKILSSALSLNFNVRNINKRFIKNKSVVISEEEKIQIINSISNIELVINEINQEFQRHDIKEYKTQNVHNKDILKTIRLTNDDMNILTESSLKNNIDISKFIRYSILNLKREFSLSSNQVEDFMYEYEIESRIVSNIAQTSFYFANEDEVLFFLKRSVRLVNDFRKNIIYFIKKYG